MRTRAPALATLLAAACSSTPTPAPTATDAAVDAPMDFAHEAAASFPGAAVVTVEHYDVALDLASRQTVARLRLRVTTAGSCVTLPFRPDAADAVTFDGMPADRVAVAGGALTACDAAGRGWPVGATVVLGATATPATGTLPRTQVGLSTRQDRTGATFTYLLSWVGECDRFGPCDNDPAHFATYHFDVTHPSGTQVLCPGTVTSGDTVTSCDFAFDGGPTYSTFAVLADPAWVPQSLGTAGGVAITLYDLPGSRIGALLDASHVRGMLTFLQGHFGPFPYGTALRYAVAPTTWAGFEHPGNIALAQTLNAGSLEHTVFHETAHQWAGDQTTVATVHDFVWKEAAAEYLAFVYEDTALGAATSAISAQLWKDSSRSLPQPPVPDGDVPLVQFYGSAYGPGPLVLFRQLEARYSRDAVMGALQDVLGHPRALSLDELRTALEHRTGASLGAYFQGWLHGSGAPVWPTVAVQHNTAADGAVTLTVDPHGTGRGLLFTVRLTGDGGAHQDVVVDTGIDGAGARVVTVHPGFVVTAHTVDPEARALVYDLPPAGTMIVEAPAPRPWLAP